jgi:hypothetical protein
MGSITSSHDLSKKIMACSCASAAHFCLTFLTRSEDQKRYSGGNKLLYERDQLQKKLGDNYHNLIVLNYIDGTRWFSY